MGGRGTHKSMTKVTDTVTAITAAGRFFTGFFDVARRC
jgi:hypothetical protein